MDFIPRYSQPFTLSEAISLDVAVITEEITRLQNSLQHLKQTQSTLQEYVEESPEDPDPEITKAFEENKIVIGSQEERILILKLALSEKGVHAGSHYDLTESTTAPTTATATVTETHEEEPSDGVYL